MTLLELLVVLVIASLMLALVAPNIGNVLPGSELKSFARQSAAMLRELRSEAVSQSRNRRLSLDQEERRFRSGKEALALWPEGVEVQLEQGEVPDFLKTPFEDDKALVFFPDGSSNGGALSLSSESAGHYMIRVEALNGKVWIDG
ncbi:hypothetical protein GCM10009104_17980 [Marinobacterium maritimum]|uniref:Type II secretion system protein H n=2 Tax=Marinobacterium maritimum TaxID=500162 RepID=A0ABP3TDY2_9GAMM